MSSPGRAKYGPEQYRAYIQSAEWRAVRERYWASKLSKNCFVCDGPRVSGMHLHHRTYKNLGAERLMDLVPVCPRCHEFIHELARDPHWKAHGGLWAATKEAQRRMHPSKMRTPGKTQRGPVGGAAERELAARRARKRLRVVERPGRGRFEVEGARLVLYVAPGTTAEARRTYLERWYRAQLREKLPTLLSEWEERLGVSVPKWTIRRMKTKWGSCNRESRAVWFNVELAKKDPASLEYIVAHELTHYFERGHGEAFTKLMDQHMPDWRKRRDELNGAPLAEEQWES